MKKTDSPVELLLSHFISCSFFWVMPEIPPTLAFVRADWYIASLMFRFIRCYDWTSFTLPLGGHFWLLLLRGPDVINYSGRRHALVSRTFRLSGLYPVSVHIISAIPRILLCSITTMLHRRAFLASFNINVTWLPSSWTSKFRIWVNYVLKEEWLTEALSVTLWTCRCLMFQAFSHDYGMESLSMVYK